MTSPETNIPGMQQYADQDNDTTGEPMHDHHETTDPQRLEQAKSVVPAFWEKIKNNPSEYLADSDRLMYVAGGGAVLRFGVEGAADSTWNKMLAAAEGGRLTIAGVDFTVSELSLMGDFYRWLKTEKGKLFHCIDERLDEDPANLSQEIHCGCGACAAIRAAVGDDASVDYEVKIARELGQVRGSEALRQPLVKEMENNHASISILVDLSTHGRSVAQPKRSELRQSDALPFNVTMPLDYIREFAERKQNDAEALISTLSRWNVQIARNIIGGHNELSDIQAETRLIVDQRDTSQPELGEVVMKYLTPIVPADKQIRIAA